MLTVCLVALVAAVALPGGAVAADGDPVLHPDPSIVDGSAAKALAAARSRWRARGPASYRFTTTRGCFCAPGWTGPFRLTVRRGRAVKPPKGAVDVATAAKLFTLVADGIRAEDHVLAVTYDRRTGFPLRISLDPIEYAVDDELTITASRPKALKPRR